jgi:hypothetical protein
VTRLELPRKSDSRRLLRLFPLIAMIILAGPSMSVGLANAGSPDYQKSFDAARTNELQLGQFGQQAFLQGDYKWSIKFLEQARSIQTNRVWQTNYPFLGGSYLLLGDRNRAQDTFNEMLRSLVGRSYISLDQPRYLLLHNLAIVRAKVSPADQPYLSAIINKVIVLASLTD